MRTTRRIGAAVALLLTTCATSAPADPPSDTDRALAQSLFDEARLAMEAGRTTEACAKFAESERLDPGGGTLLNLGICHEREGKLARAWVELNEALSRAIRDGREDREELAREHLAAISARVPRVKIALAERDRDATVMLDGDPVRSLAAAIPVDPGVHELTVAAPGRVSRVVRFEARPDGATREIAIPPLEHAPAATTSTGNGKRTAGLVVGGAGLAAIGVGAYFGLDALSKRREADAICPDVRCGSPEAVRLQDEAITAAWIANVAIGAGLVALGIGGYLVLTASPDGKSASAAVRLPLF